MTLGCRWGTCCCCLFCPCRECSRIFLVVGVAKIQSYLVRLAAKCSKNLPWNFLIREKKCSCCPYFCWRSSSLKTSWWWFCCWMLLMFFLSLLFKYHMFMAKFLTISQKRSFFLLLWNVKIQKSLTNTSFPRPFRRGLPSEGGAKGTYDD